MKFEDLNVSQSDNTSGVLTFEPNQTEAVSTMTQLYQQTVSTSGMIPPTSYSTYSFPGPSYEQTAPGLSASHWNYEPSAKRIGLSTQYSNEVSSSGYAMQAENLTVSHADFEKKKLRRERNKIAAAKCRQRRVDLTNRLQNETDILEAEKIKFTEEIRELQREKEQLEFVLQAHRPMCKIEKIPLADCPMDLKVYSNDQVDTACSVSERPKFLSIINKTSDCDLNTPVFTEKTPGASVSNPSKLLCKTEPVELNTPTWSESFPVQTPSKHTGRTPSSSGSSSSDCTPAVAGSSCAFEHKKRSSSSSSTSEAKSPVHTLISL